PVLGPGIPAGEVGGLLARATCDVAVLVERARVPRLDAEHPVLVVFGGGDQDSGALELGARIAEETGAPLRVVGSRDELRSHAAQAGLVVVGLPPDWRKAGLGRDIGDAP